LSRGKLLHFGHAGVFSDGSQISFARLSLKTGKSRTCSVMLSRLVNVRHVDVCYRVLHSGGDVLPPRTYPLWPESSRPSLYFHVFS